MPTLIEFHPQQGYFQMHTSFTRYAVSLTTMNFNFHPQIAWLMQRRRNTNALALELRLSCTNPSKCGYHIAVDDIFMIICTGKTTLHYLISRFPTHCWNASLSYFGYKTRRYGAVAIFLVTYHNMLYFKMEPCMDIPLNHLQQQASIFL